MKRAPASWRPIWPAEGYTSAVIDVRGMSSILHLKSGVSYIGEQHPGGDGRDGGP